MQKLLLLGGVAVVMFAGAAGVSYYLKQAQEHHDEKAGPAHGEAKVAAHPQRKVEPPSTAPLTPATRPPFNPAAEEIVRLRTQVKDSQDRIDAEEKRLATRKKLLDLVHDDIRKERAHVDHTRKELNELLKTIDDNVSLLERKSTELEKKNRKQAEQIKSIQSSLLEVDGVEADRLKQMASMYDQMEAEKAGPLLQQMSDGGNLDIAVKILSSMKERQAARVLDAIPNRATVIQILEKMTKLKKNDKTAAGGP